MNDELKTYTNGEVTVHWKPIMCIHAGECVRNLKTVFNPKNRPWVNMEGGSTEEIKAAIDQCPSGALSYYVNEKYMIQAVIFDMDGLLINSEPYWRLAMIEAFQEVGLPFTEENCRETTGFRIDEVVDLWYRRTPWKSKAPQAVSLQIIDLVKQHVRASGIALPGVQVTLDLLRDQNLRLALASSSSMALIDAVLDRLNIRSYFEVVHSAEFEAYGKPHPQVFISTAEKLNCKPENCVVIEDSLNGIIAGKAAKMKVIAIPEAENLNNPAFAIADRQYTSLEQFQVEHLHTL